ncbi:hypothetical protein ACFGVR_05015 [Mucilaginibacter sp. AW1-3]
MKKLHLLIIIAAFAFAACQTGHHTTIVTNNNGRYVKLEYAGNISLTNDGAAISGISPGGYLKYQTNDEKIVAKSNMDGDILYELNGEKQNQLNTEGKRLIALAAKEIAKHDHR